jgi:D-alanyl-D-alanine carboxypeptidase
VRDIADAGESPHVAWADGALVSNAADLARFYSALLGGRIVSRTTLAEMEHTVPVISQIFDADGLGIFSSAQQCGHFWGHTGGILDSLTGVLASPDGSRVAVVAYRAKEAHPIDIVSLVCF